MRPFVALGAGVTRLARKADDVQLVAIFNELWSRNQSVSVGAHRLSIRASILAPVWGSSF